MSETKVDEKQLTEWEALAKAATPSDDWRVREEDVPFLVAAREAVPALIDEVRRQRDTGAYRPSRERLFNNHIAAALHASKKTAQEAADLYADQLDEMRQRLRRALEVMPMGPVVLRADDGTPTLTVESRDGGAFQRPAPEQYITYLDEFSDNEKRQVEAQLRAKGGA